MPFTRRAWFMKVAALPVLAAILTSLFSRNSAARTHASSPREESRANEFMRHAVAMRDKAVADGDQPFGGVVASPDGVVGEGPSRVIVHQDPTAHAEMEAIRDAARRLGRRSLSGMVLYSTSPPCPMCESAAYWAGIDELIYRESLDTGGPPRLGGC
jgi:tRNA(Arg) A34 adenosine deaminase TadA